MAFDIFKLIVFGVNSGYLLYMGASEQNLIYAGIGAVLLFVMIGLVSFTTGYENIWTLLFVFAVTIPFNIKTTEMLLFGMIRGEHSDWFDEIYESNYTHELFQRGYSYLTGWSKAFTVVAGIVICTLIVSVELLVSGLIARMLWPEQKNDAFEPIDTDNEIENLQSKVIDEEKNNG